MSLGLEPPDQRVTEGVWAEDSRGSGTGAFHSCFSGFPQLYRAALHPTLRIPVGQGGDLAGKAQGLRGWPGQCVIMEAIIPFLPPLFLCFKLMALPVQKSSRKCLQRQLNTKPIAV